jgi:hypothetical protein
MRQCTWTSAGNSSPSSASRKIYDKQREAQVLEGEVAMKRIAVLAMMVVLSGSLAPSGARSVSLTDDSRQSEKEAQKKQKALEKYRRAQQKAQAKAQQREDKKQRKAAAKYEKEQRKLLKNANRPAKQAS